MPEKLEGKYMRAKIEPLENGKKTRSYRVLEVSTGYTLGWLKWFGRWRGYCFFPVTGTVFDGGCLAQLDAWISELDGAYRDTKKEARND